VECAACGAELACPGCNPEAREHQRATIRLKREARAKDSRIQELERVLEHVRHECKLAMAEVLTNHNATRYPVIFGLSDDLRKLEDSGWKEEALPRDGPGA
jgi:hypothetical protein